VNRFIALFFQIIFMMPSLAYHADLAIEVFRWILIAAAVLVVLVLVLSALGGSFSFFGYYWF